MSTAEFIVQFANAIEVDPALVQADTEFKSLDNWDSLCALSIIAMVDESYQVTLGGEDLESSKTVANLWTLIESRK
jgi:acyl carrier protein